MKILLIIIGIFFYFYCFIKMLKFSYILLAIKKVWLPMFYENRKYFINDSLLIKLKGYKLLYYMSLLIFLLFLMIFIPSQLVYMIICMIAALIIAKLTFNPYIYEKDFFIHFSSYLKNEYDNL